MSTTAATPLSRRIVGPGSRLIAGVALGALTASFIALSALWSVLVPPLKAPDEAAHFSTALMLTEGFQWPSPGEARLLAFVPDLEAELSLPPGDRATISELREIAPGFSSELNQMTQHPPVYYMAVAGVFRIIGIDGMSWDQALLSMRLLGVLIAAPVIPLVYATVRSMTGGRGIALVAAAAVFAVPGMTQMVAMANNDTPAILLGALLAWLTARIWTGDRRRRTLLAAGIVFGLAGLVKATLLVFALPLAVCLLFGHGRPQAMLRRVRDLVWPFAVSLVCGQWWLLRNLVLFGTLQPYGYMLSDSTWPDGQTPNAFAFAAEFARVASTTFWGWFGRVNAPLPAWLVVTLSAIGIGVIAAGLVRASRRRRLDLVFLLAPVALALILMVRVSWGAYVDTAEYRGMHGRYFYPVVSSLIAATAVAATSTFPRGATRRIVALCAVTISGAMAALGPLITLDHFYGGVGRAALSAWVTSMSPAPPVVTIGIGALAVVTTAIAFAVTLLALWRLTTDTALRSEAQAATEKGSPRWQ